jgi:hypothetical protein
MWKRVLRVVVVFPFALLLSAMILSMFMPRYGIEATLMAAMLTAMFDRGLAAQHKAQE